MQEQRSTEEPDVIDGLNWFRTQRSKDRLMPRNCDRFDPERVYPQSKSEEWYDAANLCGPR